MYNCANGQGAKLGKCFDVFHFLNTETSNVFKTELGNSSYKTWPVNAGSLSRIGRGSSWSAVVTF